MLGRNAIAAILQAEGVECFTCFPENGVIDAAASLGIRPILARTERVAINIADGFTRIRNGRSIGVCALQYAGGVENAFAGVAQAFGDNTPILLLPGGYGRAQQGSPPNFQATRNYHAVTQWVETVNQAGRLPQMLARAFTRLRNGPLGPVMLETPIDVLKEALPDDFSYMPTRRSAPLGDPQDVKEAVRMLLAAANPVIVAGQGVFYAEAWRELQEFAQLVQVPVMTTFNGMSAFPGDHPLALGAGALAHPRTVDHFLKKADVVFGVGTSFTRSVFIAAIPSGKTMVQVVHSATDMNKDYPIAHGIIGDARNVLLQMTEEARLQLGGARRDGAALCREIAEVKAAFIKKWLPRLTSNDTPISPYRVVWDLLHTVDRRRAIVTHDAGNPRDQMTGFFEALIPHGYIGWGKSTQLDSSLSFAMSAKLAAPDHLVVNVMGDAGFGMVGMDFETAVRMGIPILTVILNNSAFGGYEKYMPVSTERYRSKYLSGDMSAVAAGLGGYSERVTHPAEIVPALRRCIQETAHGRPCLLEIITREEPVFPLGQDDE